MKKWVDYEKDVEILKNYMTEVSAPGIFMY